MGKIHKLLGFGLLLVAAPSMALGDATSECRTAGDFDQRIAACTAVLISKTVSQTELATAHRNRAAAYVAIRLNPNFASAYSGRARAKLALKDYEAAISDYSLAIGLNPRSSTDHVDRGYAQMVRGRPKDAVKDFTTAIAISPNNAMAFNNRGVARRKLGQTDLAITDYTTAVQINPIYALAYNNRGYAHEAKGHKEDAIADYGRALRLDPALAGAKNGLVRVGGKQPAVTEAAQLIRDGKALAERTCAWCHAMTEKGMSPNDQAPPFRVINQRHPILALREPLERSIAYPHAAMPKIKLTDNEIDTIIAYINSLGPQK